MSHNTGPIRVAVTGGPWREIYRPDSERDQTYDEAVRVCQSVRKWYVQCGYNLIDVRNDA
jgi:predicted ATPase